MKCTPLFLACASLAACTTTRAPRFEPLSDASEVAVHYSARLATAVGIVNKARPESAVDAVEPQSLKSPMPPTTTLVQVQCKLIEMDRDDARAWLGVDLCGRRTTRAEAERLLAGVAHGGDADVIIAPSLTLFDGREGSIATLTPHEFVEAFEVAEAGDDGVSIGDPVVATVSEGFDVQTTPTVLGEEGRVRLELRLRSREVLESKREVTARLPGIDAAVTLGQPLCYTQTVSASADLGREQVLVVGGLPTKREDRVLVALFSTRVAVPETAAMPNGEPLKAP